MISGLLRPAEDTRDAWLLPIMAAPWRHGLGKPGQPWHYPKPPLVVPAEQLQSVLDDDTLHCVCNHLCCDRQVVHVSGSQVKPGADSILDGAGRDWRLHLELRPLSGRCLLEIPIEATITADVADPKAEPIVTISHNAAVIQNIQGVIFRDFDFRITVNIHCASADRDKVKYVIQALLDCVRGCHGCAFRGCAASIAVTIHNLNQHKPRHIYELDDEPDGHGPGTPGWGGGGAGGGDGGGGGGPGSPGWGSGGAGGGGIRDGDGPGIPDWNHGGYGWDLHGDKDVFVQAAAWRDCRKAVFFSSSANITIDIESLMGAESLANGWQDCGGWLHRLCRGTLANSVKITGSGQSYTHSDGSHGVTGYTLAAIAQARLVASSGGGEISTLAGSATATAVCTAGNQPYHTSSKGNTSYGKIGGSAQAIALGMASNSGGAISACDITCQAKAVHPTAHAALAAPYRGNTAKLAANTGSIQYCDSNIPAWCDGGQ